jgi:hypothetical protein
MMSSFARVTCWEEITNCAWLRLQTPRYTILKFVTGSPSFNASPSMMPCT